MQLAYVRCHCVITSFHNRSFDTYLLSIKVLIVVLSNVLYILMMNELWKYKNISGSHLRKNIRTTVHHFTFTFSDDTSTCAEEGPMWTWSKPCWFKPVQEEYWACKERVCLMDMSSFTKIEVKVSWNTRNSLLFSYVVMAFSRLGINI